MSRVRLFLPDFTTSSRQESASFLDVFDLRKHSEFLNRPMFVCKEQKFRLRREYPPMFATFSNSNGVLGRTRSTTGKSIIDVLDDGVVLIWEI